MIGQVLDPSSLDAIVDDRVAASGWLITAHDASTPLHVPGLALTEVRALRPHLLERLYELLEHPSIVRRELDPATGEEVAELLERTGTFDVCAGQIVVVAQQRGWPVITADPGRLRRIEPDLEVLLV